MPGRGCGRPRALSGVRQIRQGLGEVWSGGGVAAGDSPLGPPSDTLGLRRIKGKGQASHRQTQLTSWGRMVRGDASLSGPGPRK